MKTARFLCVGFLTGTFSLLTAVSALAQSDPFLARVWDSAINLPPGAYRAAKPIELDGKFEVTTSPWTLIDGVVFNGAQSNQHWNLDGTIMRRVSLSGQLGIGLDAKDSIFENCELSKTGGWFVSMWGSNWRFDNCIFTDKFMRDDLPVGDYSVRATHCTFYDVKLPTISVKDDPGSYLQKGRMGFVKCRFVRCNVPESFLAATVDCVFEDCQFPSKRQNWPAQMSSLQVNAMFSGLADAPESFLNGPLSVRFTEAPPTPDAGSTLPHSYSGGDITLNNYNPPLEYVNFGSVQKRSSEIVPSAGDSKDIFAGSPSAAAPPAGNSVDVHSFDDLVRSLPQNINLINDGQPDIDSIDLANKWLSDHFAGHNAALPIQYGAGEAANDSGAAYRLTSGDQSVLCGGTTLVGRSICLFPAENAGPLSQMARGADMTVLGIIKNVEIRGRGHNLDLVLTIANARLQ